MDEIRALIDELVGLTNGDQIIWSGEPSLICAKCIFEGRKIKMTAYQDEPPYFEIDGNGIQGYGYGIEELNHAIWNQIQRHEPPRELSEFEKQQRARKEKELENLKSSAKKLLKDIKKKR